MKKCFFLCLILFFPINVNAKRGCCSWHGGVSHCGDNGKYVCNDGTYSPSCTCVPTLIYKYGCTDSNAINYDSTATKDDGSCVSKIFGCMNKNAVNYNSIANIADGSCRFEIIEVKEEEIQFSTIIEKGNKNWIKQVGKNGLKKITTKIIKNESGNIISSSIVEIEVIEEPVDEVIVEKQEEDTSSNSGNVFLNLIFLCSIGIVIWKKKKK